MACLSVVGVCVVVELSVSVFTFCTFSFSRSTRCVAYLPVFSRPARQAGLIHTCTHHRRNRSALRETAPSSNAANGKVQKMSTAAGHGLTTAHRFVF